MAEMIEKLVLKSVSNRVIVIFLTTIVTAASVWYAVRLEPTFDVKDFFDSNSGFVVGLDKIDEHLGGKGGEPGVVYIEGDLMDPKVVLQISQFIDSLREVESIAETPSGEITIGLNIVNVSKMIMNNPYAINMISETTGTIVTDYDTNGIPDTKDQMKQVFGFLIERGLVNSKGSFILKPEDANGAVYYSGSGNDITTVSFQIPGTRDQSVVGRVEKELVPMLATLEASSKITKVGLTGSPFTRDVQLSASTKTLYTSLPIAVIAATLLLMLTMRSLKYAVVTVIPVILVVAWLYGIMYALGFALNFVTAMIGAISIGVGIDYSIHMTQRYREELKMTDDPLKAIRIAARGTGLALVASAASSIVGFAIMGMAPMPMFSSYGQLTAIMIFLSLLASLVILPSMLIFASKIGSPRSKLQR
jgi:predicted RND superfamily exporter protein